MAFSSKASAVRVGSGAKLTRCRLTALMAGWVRTDDMPPSVTLCKAGLKEWGTEVVETGVGACGPLPDDEMLEIGVGACGP